MPQRPQPHPPRRTLLTTALAATAATTAAACQSAEPPAPTPSPTPTPTTPPKPDPKPPTSTPTNRPQDWPALARTLDGPLLLPQSPDYASAHRLYNTRFDHLKPAAIAYVAHEADVRAALAYARATRTPVAIRNGGHSYAGWSSGTGRLIIDVSKLDHIKTTGTTAAAASHTASHTATVSAGARLIDVYETLAASGRTVPGGSCPSVGISGLTLGGGHGVVSRAYGLTCDSLTAATLVTADGSTLRCDAKENPDLFWALRGAGNGQFGVVTSLEFRTHPAARTVTGNLTWPWSQAPAVLTAWQQWGPGQSDEIWSAAHFSAGAGGGNPTVSVSLCSLGTHSDLANAVDRLAEAVRAAPRSTSLRPHSYREAMRLYAGCADLSDAQCHLPGTTPGRTPEGALGRETYDSRSDFFARALDPAGVRTLLSGVENFTRVTTAQGGGGATIALTALGGAVNRVAPEATAFVHRRMRMLAQYTASWRPGTPGTAQQRWLTTTHASMRRHASGSAYQNYTDPTLPDWRRAYFGSAADRLTTLKSRHDPDHVFDFPQAL
ncbi:FAD-binding oxidoreductase [Streptomyces sp. NPDC051561]|uniref:FAD-binding oxidoreductase n=1 Tax=Streptomyces sp. NPDC051561 TaxID=3365658 RepID=UPI003787297C